MILRWPKSQWALRLLIVFTPRWHPLWNHLLRLSRANLISKWVTSLSKVHPKIQLLTQSKTNNSMCLSTRLMRSTSLSKFTNKITKLQYTKVLNQLFLTKRLSRRVLQASSGSQEIQKCLKNLRKLRKLRLLHPVLPPHLISETSSK